MAVLHARLFRGGTRTEKINFIRGFGHGFTFTGEHIDYLQPQHIFEFPREEKKTKQPKLHLKEIMVCFKQEFSTSFTLFELKGSFHFQYFHASISESNTVHL